MDRLHDDVDHRHEDEAFDLLLWGVLPARIHEDEERVWPAPGGVEMDGIGADVVVAAAASGISADVLALGHYPHSQQICKSA